MTAVSAKFQSKLTLLNCISYRVIHLFFQFNYTQLVQFFCVQTHQRVNVIPGDCWNCTVLQTKGIFIEGDLWDSFICCEPHWSALDNFFKSSNMFRSNWQLSFSSCVLVYFPALTKRVAPNNSCLTLSPRTVWGGAKFYPHCGKTFSRKSSNISKWLETDSSRTLYTLKDDKRKRVSVLLRRTDQCQVCQVMCPVMVSGHFRA